MDTKTQNNDSDVKQPGADSALSASPGSGLAPFKLRVYDGNGNEHEFGPVWIEIPNPEPWDTVPDDDAGGHWEHLARMETWAKNYLFEDAECSLDTDALSSQNAESRNADDNQ